jgi:hypothetical protein
VPVPMDNVFKFLSATGTILGSWAVIRSYWLTRSKLAIMQKRDKGHNSYANNGWLLEVVICNLSSQANAILEWTAWLKNKGGELIEIRVKQGRVTDSKTGNVDSVFNFTPVNIGPHSSTLSNIAFFDIRQDENAFPLTLKVQAKDMYGKRYECWCKYPL